MLIVDKLKKVGNTALVDNIYKMESQVLAKKFGIKIEFEVHKTTIRILKEVVKDKEVLKLLKIGYKEFVEMANDLFKAKKERTNAQYYTGTDFMKEKYKEKSREFLNNVVIPYLNKMQEIIT